MEMPLEDQLQLDPGIIAALPRGSKVTKFEKHGVSDWAWTARVDTDHEDAPSKSYFLKILRTPDAAARVLGEYASMLEIHTTLPSIAPQPLAHGQCLADPSAHFFLCDYLHLARPSTITSRTPNTSENTLYPLPDPARLASKLAQLHRASASPTGAFGFHCPVFDGRLPLTVDWDASWPSFFARLLRDVYALDVRANGVDDELDALMQIVLERVVPRLLGVLKGVRPVLIHGDLWEGNVGTLESSGEVVVYDACAYYAHHEKEVGIWRYEHHGLRDEVYRREYFRLMPPSEPVEEADDRNRLYAVETLLIHSAHFPGAETRGRAVEELRWLVQKYGDGL